MNPGEGLHRVATIIRVIGWLGAALMAATALLTAFEPGRGLDYLAACVILTAAPVAIAYGIAWIIDGFSAPK